ncbi:MAG: hypothetical protein KGK07_09630 [Chloroflexota bacterium]|nr:hypothetical protein [Chloroflexota bacterium]
MGVPFSRPSAQTSTVLAAAVLGTMTPIMKLALPPPAPRLAVCTLLLVIKMAPEPLRTTAQTSGCESVVVSSFVIVPVTVSCPALSVALTLDRTALPGTVLPTMSAESKFRRPNAVETEEDGALLVAEKKSGMPFCHERRHPCTTSFSTTVPLAPAKVTRKSWPRKFAPVSLTSSAAYVSPVPFCVSDVLTRVHVPAKANSPTAVINTRARFTFSASSGPVQTSTPSSRDYRTNEARVIGRSHKDEMRLFRSSMSAVRHVCGCAASAAAPAEPLRDHLGLAMVFGSWRWAPPTR